MVGVDDRRHESHTPPAHESDHKQTNSLPHTPTCFAPALQSVQLSMTSWKYVPDQSSAGIATKFVEDVRQDLGRPPTGEKMVEALQMLDPVEV